MRTSSLALGPALVLAAFGAALAVPATGCASSPSIGADEANSTADDLALAKEVVGMLGGEEGACKSCHGVTATKVKAWGTAMKAVEDECFAPTLTEAERVNCLRVDPNDPASAFSARRLGLYSAGVNEANFQGAFEGAGLASDYAAFKTKTHMPRGGAAFTTDQFAKLKGWVLRGMPQLDQAFGAPPVTEPTPACTPKTTPELAAHIAAMKTEGWGARLADQATPMFGCGAATNPGDCLTAFPDDTQAYTAPAVPQTLRRINAMPLQSHYWVRSSADGRYLGYGMNDSAKVIDLAQEAGSGKRDIQVAADYDPFFLPSNDGFAFAGSHEDGAIRLCRQSLLSDATESAEPFVELTESKCADIGQDVYMSIGTALDGNRYFMTFGSHENDDGGHDITTPLPAAFSPNASTLFTPMVNDGQSYKAQAGVRVKLPGEGDMMLSPSSMVAATRFGDGRKSKGFRIRLIKASASSPLTVEAPLGAEVCVPGAKGNFSFDERFMVTHQYVDHTEPDQAQLPEGSSNIVLVDLLTSKTVRITNVKEGQFALYPHFRADGWIYFIVRDMNTDEEFALASDAAIRMAAQQ